MDRKRSSIGRSKAVRPAICLLGALFFVCVLSTSAYAASRMANADGKQAGIEEIGTPKVLLAGSTPGMVKIDKTTMQGGDKVAVYWKKVSGADGYEVYKAASKNGSYKKVKTTGSGTRKYTCTVASGKTIYVKVRAFKNNGAKKVYGKFSAIKQVGNFAYITDKNFAGTYYRKGMNKEVSSTAGAYHVTINKITGAGKVVLALTYMGRNYSPLYQTNKITAQINGKKASFKWKDTWGNSGTGTITFDKRRQITLTVKETKNSGYNRGTLAVENAKFLYFKDERTIYENI